MDVLLVGLLPPLIVGLLVAFLAYWVIRRAVRDGILDAKELDRELTAARKAHRAYTTSPPPSDSQ